MHAVQVVHFLLENGADPNAADTTGMGPLHHAARRGLSEIVDAIVNTGGAFIEVGRFTVYRERNVDLQKEDTTHRPFVEVISKR
jgi:ankyrin repeat protein